MSTMIVERGPLAGKRISLTKFPVKVGRDPTNDLVVPDDEVSRFHFRIKQRGKLYVLEDLESRNGTFLNGDRVLNSIIKNGDKILFGANEMIFANPDAEVEITHDIMDFDMIVAEELGLKGPIELGKGKVDQKFTPIRLNHIADGTHLLQDNKSLKLIFELQGNILVTNNLEEAGNTLLKSIKSLMPSASRGAFFTWSSSSRQLIPSAIWHYSQPKQPFLLSQRSMEDVITRKTGILLQMESPQATFAGRHRLILPMLHNDEPICVVHLESDSPHKAFTALELELVQALINRSAPSFESMLLRRELDSWMVGMIGTMIATLEAKDTYTHGHSERVSRYCMAIADELKLNREIKRLLLISALCHDIGKIGVPDAILKKASLLDAEEYEEMKQHPTIGAEIISHMPNAQRFLSGIKYHHEKWDGTGYPDGLVGENIPFFGRIVGISDVFDAMVSGRAYSGFIDQSEAVERLIEEKELFDPEILKAFVRAHESGRLTLKTHTRSNHVGDSAEEDDVSSLLAKDSHPKKR